MIKLIAFIVITSIAIILGPMLADSQGFVHIATNTHIVETSLTTAIVLYLASIILLFIIYAVVKKIISIPRGTLRIFKARATKKKLDLQDQAVIFFEQGQYDKSLALLKHTSSIKNMPEKSLLIAAQDAFYLGLYDYTRQALDEAQSRGKSAKLAADVIRAKLNYNVGNAKVAPEYLDSTRGQVKNKCVYELYFKCYLQLGLFDKISSIQKDLCKFEVITKEKARSYFLKDLEIKVKNAQSMDELESLFKLLNKTDKKDPKIMGAFVFKLIKLGDVNRARSITLDLLKVSQDPAFLDSIANWDITIPDVLVALKKYASSNMITTQVNLPLLKAMGNLEFRSGLLRDALADYKQALTIEASTDIYLKIGAILNSLQNYPEAAEYYAKANEMQNEASALTLDVK